MELGDRQAVLVQLNVSGLENHAVQSNLCFYWSKLASLLAVVLIVAALPSPLLADSGLLTLSQDVAPNAGRVVLDLNFSSTAPSQTQAAGPAGLEWALAFNARSVANISVAPGAGAIAAGKSIACYQANGTYSCLATGLNSNSMLSGSIAQMTVTFAPSYEGLVSFGVTNTRGVTAAGATVPISGKGATVVVYGLTSLVCSPTAVASASFTNCTVTMSPAAPSGGAKIFLASNSPMLVVPTAVIMPAGTTSAIFSAHTGHISVKRSATVTASYSGSLQSATLSLNSARSHPRILSCGQPTLAAGNSTACTLALSGEAESGEFTVFGGPNIRVPPVIAARPGQRSVRFQASADALSPRQTASITVHDGTFSLSQALDVLPSSAPVLTLPGRRFARFGQAVEFTVAAADPSGLPSILMAADIPKGASFNAASGRFAWTPDPSQAGQFDIAFTATNSAAASATGHVFIEAGSGRPFISAIRNAASQEPAGCSPGTVATLTGSWLSAHEQTAGDASGASMQLAGARVIVNDVDVPVLAAAPERIDFLCPEAQPGTPLSISVENEYGRAAAIQTIIQPPTPGILSRDRSGRGQGLVTFSGTSLLAASRTHEAIGQPAQAGDVLTIMAVGMDPTAALPLVRIGDILVSARSVAAIPGQAGVYGVEIPVPPGLPEGDTVPLTILPSTPGGARSNTVTLAIE
jgi:uncharacterized protein (TIGR03437 family)